MAALRERAYDVSLVEALVDSGFGALRDWLDARPALIVTTPTVHRLYGDALRDAFRGREQAPMLTLHCSELDKSLDHVLDVCEQAAAIGIGRRGVLVGVGGGVCTDIVTLASALIRRGVDYARVPTTLVGLVDAGIGIKGAVNFASKKSFLGCFQPPSAVFLDPTFLRTLPERHMRCGFAEIVKMGLACDQRLFACIEEHWPVFGTTGSPAIRDAVWWSVERMLEQLESNLYEDRGFERVVDLGHTFSPTLESASRHGLLHGEAVAIDIALSCVLANERQTMTEAERDRVLALLQRMGLDLWSDLLTSPICRGALEEAARHRGGHTNLVLPRGIGSVDFIGDSHEISDAEIERALSTLRDIAHARRC